jgi:hypothetical protein
MRRLAWSVLVPVRGVGEQGEGCCLMELRRILSSKATTLLLVRRLVQDNMCVFAAMCLAFFVRSGLIGMEWFARATSDMAELLHARIEKCARSGQ